MKRLTPNVVSKRLTTSKSSRGGANPKLIVLHTTQGVMRLRDRAKFWDGRDASAHAGVGNRKFGEQESSARYVKDDDKAWTQAFYNPVSLSVEIEGFAEQASWDRGTVREVARWIAHWSIHENIPIRFGHVFAGKVIRSGVIRHKSLGLLGGGHTDPGTFPMRDAMRLAKSIKKQRLA